MRKGTIDFTFMEPCEGILICVDPGKNNAGLAIFRKKVLVACGFAVSKEGEGPARWLNTAQAVVDKLHTMQEGSHRDGLKCDTLAVEHMETRSGRTDAHGDLIELSQVSGAIWAMLPWEKGYAVKPAWTGGRNKQVNGARIRSRLSVGETAILEHGLFGVPAGNVKEVVDAVGIGLFVNRRL